LSIAILVFSINIVPGDEFRVVTRFTDEMKVLLLRIRDSAVTNMFDIGAVQRIAFENEWYELVDFLEADRGAYALWVLRGE